MTTHLQPVSPDERVHALDLLRGWAMFGVLWSNLNGDYGTRNPTTALDHALSWTQDWLIQSRFYSLLILLFGIGFGIQLMRADANATEVRTTYYRRTAALLIIGVVHGTLIWHGDILTIYALVAFALVMFRSATTKQLLVAALICWFIGPVIVREAMYLGGLRFVLPRSYVETVYSHGTWQQIEHARIGGYLQWLGRWGLSSYVSILASFLMGLWAVKSGYFRRVVDDPGTTRRLLLISVIAAAIGYASWAWGNNVYPRAEAPANVVAHFPYPYFQREMLRSFVFKLFDWGTLGTALAYACLLLVAWRRPLGQRMLRPLAAAGRMALTTYLTQSVVCTLLFYSYGLGWYGTVGFTGMFIITLVLFATQMAVSMWWLARFRYGPAEWLWRTITYGRAPVMRIVQPSASAA